MTAGSIILLVIGVCALLACGYAIAYFSGKRSGVAAEAHDAAVEDAEATEEEGELAVAAAHKSAVEEYDEAVEAERKNRELITDSPGDYFSRHPERTGD